MLRVPITLLSVFGLLLSVKAVPTSELVAYASSDNSLQSAADQKKVIIVETSDQYITGTYGAKSPSKIKTLLVLESTLDPPDTTFVFGKDCDNDKCAVTPPKSVYAEQGTKNGTWKAGTLQGSLFEDTITLGGVSFTALFGSASQSSTTKYNNNGDGQFNLAIGNSPSTMLKTLFALGPERYVTIYREYKNMMGQLLIGRNGHDKCNDAKMYTTTADSHWWISDAKIKVDDKSIDKQKVEFSINEQNIKIPQAQYDALIKDQKPDGGSLVGDATKLKSIELTLGSDVYVLKPEDFTDKTQDNKYYVKVAPTAQSEPANIVLGIPFLQKNCYVLNGKDDDTTKWLIGVGEHKNSATMMSASAVLLVALAQLLRF